MRFTVSSLAGDVQSMDFSDLTSAKVTGPASWVPGVFGVLEVPFDRDLTDREFTAVQARLMGDPGPDAWQALAAFEAMPAPTPADMAAQLKNIGQILRGLRGTPEE